MFLEIPGILTLAECKTLVEVSDYVLAEQDDAANGGYTRARKADLALAVMIEDRIKQAVTGYGTIRDAKWQRMYVHPKWFFTRYRKGDSIAPHRDGPREEPRGKSFATILVYLNSNFGGGETCSEDETVKPYAGKVLILDQQVEHWGNSVTHGTKYVLRSDLMYPQDNRN